VVVNMAVFVGDADAWATVRQGVLHVEGRYEAWMAERRDATPETTAVVDRVGAMQEAPAHIVVGDAAHCAAALAPWHESLSRAPAGALPHLNVRLHYPGVGRDATLRSIDMFAREIAPRLREEDIAWT
jgi:hypothetical protein